ncbi:MAG: hypothetical protein RR838_13155 [Clostridium sp.]
MSVEITDHLEIKYESYSIKALIMISPIVSVISILMLLPYLNFNLNIADTFTFIDFLSFVFNILFKHLALMSTIYIPIILTDAKLFSKLISKTLQISNTTKASRISIRKKNKLINKIGLFVLIGLNMTVMGANIRDWLNNTTCYGFYLDFHKFRIIESILFSVGILLIFFELIIIFYKRKKLRINKAK